MVLALKEITANSPMTGMINQIMFVHFTRMVFAPMVAIADMNMLKFLMNTHHQLQQLQHPTLIRFSVLPDVVFARRTELL